MVFRLMQIGEDPCVGCNNPLEQCDGRPKKTSDDTISQPVRPIFTDPPMVRRKRWS